MVTKGDAFIKAGARTKVGSKFVIGGAKTGRSRIGTEAKHGIIALCDLTDGFATWMAAQEYRASYFASSDDLDIALGAFRRTTADRVCALLSDASSDQDSVVALLGVASLFGFFKVSALVEDVAPTIRGRLLVFFPGEHEGNNYRLLDARDGWNYLAVPIMTEKGG